MSEETQRADGLKMEITKGGNRFYVIGTPDSPETYELTSYAYGRKIDSMTSGTQFNANDMLAAALEASVDPVPATA